MGCLPKSAVDPLSVMVCMSAGRPVAERWRGDLLECKAEFEAARAALESEATCKDAVPETMHSRDEDASPSRAKVLSFGYDRYCIAYASR